MKSQIENESQVKSSGRRRIIINIVKHASKKAPSKHKVVSVESLAHHVTAVITGTLPTMLQEDRQELGLDRLDLAEQRPSKASRSSDSHRIGRRGHHRQVELQEHPLVGACPGLAVDPKTGLAVVSIGHLLHHIDHCDHYDHYDRLHGHLRLQSYCSYPSVQLLVVVSGFTNATSNLLLDLPSPR
jgi:hypothetical protein